MAIAFAAAEATMAATCSHLRHRPISPHRHFDSLDSDCSDCAHSNDKLDMGHTHWSGIADGMPDDGNIARFLVDDANAPWPLQTNTSACRI